MDNFNRRVLVWNAIPTQNQAPASLALGQPNMTSSTSNNGGVKAQSMGAPYYVFGDGTRIYVTDYNDNRVLIWNSIPTTSGASASPALGQPNMTSSTSNNGGLSAASLWHPTSAYSDGTNLYVTDSTNYRTLIWNGIPTATGAPANVVLGQPDMTTNTFVSTPSATNFNSSPQSAYSDGTRLFVPDPANNRVLIWNPIPAANGAAANAVLGQPNMTSATLNNGGLSAASLYSPRSVFSDGTRAYISDYLNNRVIVFPLP